jgi:hypothetical protein
MTQRTINPQLILAAAQMAVPGKTWKILTFMGWDDWVTVIGAKDDSRFNPLQSDGDAWALERALKDKVNGGWRFWKFQYGDSDNEGMQTFVADAVSHGQITEPSDTLLLLKALASQTNIPMFAEVV